MLYHNLIDLKDFQIMYTECTLLFGIRQEQTVWLYWDLLFRAVRDCSNLLRHKSHLLCLLLFLISVIGLKFQSHILYIENWEKQWHHCMQNQQLKRGCHGIQGFFYQCKIYRRQVGYCVWPLTLNIISAPKTSKSWVAKAAVNLIVKLR